MILWNHLNHCVTGICVSWYNSYFYAIIGIQYILLSFIVRVGDVSIVLDRPRNNSVSSYVIVSTGLPALLDLLLIFNLSLSLVLALCSVWCNYSSRLNWAGSKFQDNSLKCSKHKKRSNWKKSQNRLVLALFFNSKIFCCFAALEGVNLKLPEVSQNDG